VVEAKFCTEHITVYQVFLQVIVEACGVMCMKQTFFSNKCNVEEAGQLVIYKAWKS